MDREAWCAAVHEVTKSGTWLSDWTELLWFCVTCTSVVLCDVHWVVLCDRHFCGSVWRALSGSVWWALSGSVWQALLWFCVTCTEWWNAWVTQWTRPQVRSGKGTLGLLISEPTLQMSPFRSIFIEPHVSYLCAYWWPCMEKGLSVVLKWCRMSITVEDWDVPYEENPWVKQTPPGVN